MVFLWYSYGFPWSLPGGTEKASAHLASPDTEVQILRHGLLGHLRCGAPAAQGAQGAQGPARNGEIEWG